MNPGFTATAVPGISGTDTSETSTGRRMRRRASHCIRKVAHNAGLRKAAAKKEIFRIRGDHIRSRRNKARIRRTMSPRKTTDNYHRPAVGQRCMRLQVLPPRVLDRLLLARVRSFPRATLLRVPHVRYGFVPSDGQVPRVMETRARRNFRDIRVHRPDVAV